MAIPAAPQNFFLQQASGQVLLTWDYAGGAIDYLVYRSTDGLNYNVIAAGVALNTYLDTTVSVGVEYFYKVSSLGSTGESVSVGPSIEPFSVVPTLAGQMSLSELRLRAKQRADRVNSEFVTTPEWNYYLSQSAYELYDLLITVYEDYYLAPRLLIATTGAQSYALPDGSLYNSAPAFYKMYGCDLGLDSSTNAYITLRKYNFASRNRYVFPQLTSQYLGLFNLEYRILGNTISFIPTPSANQNFGLWYFPRLSPLMKDTDILDGISGWTEYVIVDAAIKALNKEESDTSVLMQEKMALKMRIESSAINRDAGQPDTISDIRSGSERWGSYGYDGPSGGV